MDQGALDDIVRLRRSPREIIFGPSNTLCVVEGKITAALGHAKVPVRSGLADRSRAGGLFGAFCSYLGSNRDKQAYLVKQRLPPAYSLACIGLSL
jgi:hypothetical protein